MSQYTKISRNLVYGYELLDLGHELLEVTVKNAVVSW